MDTSACEFTVANHRSIWCMIESKSCHVNLACLLTRPECSACSLSLHTDLLTYGKRCVSQQKFVHSGPSLVSVPCHSFTDNSLMSSAYRFAILIGRIDSSRFVLLKRIGHSIRPPHGAFARSYVHALPLYSAQRIATNLCEDVRQTGCLMMTEKRVWQHGKR